jgi:hypothetical protein
MRTLADIKESVLELVQKNPSYQGFFTDKKMGNMINEALDYISVNMFEAGEGWLREIRYLDWTANSRVLQIPSDVAIINNVRWKTGNTYNVLKYDIADTSAQQEKGTGTGIPTVYRIIQGKFYVNPEPADGGTAQVELEFSRYPTLLVSSQQTVQSDFDRAMLHWLKYYVANTLISSAGKEAPFAKNEAQWYSQMEKVIILRNRVKKVVEDFGG